MYRTGITSTVRPLNISGGKQSHLNTTCGTDQP